MKIGKALRTGVMAMVLTLLLAVACGGEENPAENPTGNGGVLERPGRPRLRTPRRRRPPDPSGWTTCCAPPR